METNFDFKSQICTDKIQSERLLALGLKKETRDVVLKKYIHNDKYCYKPVFEDIDDCLIDCNNLYPAWSFGRLIEMLPDLIYPKKELPSFSGYAYLNLTNIVVWYNY